MHGCLFGKMIHTQYPVGRSIGHSVLQIGIIDYDKMPRLRITSRRRKTGCLYDTGQFFRLDSFFGIVPAIALTLLDQIEKSFHFQIFSERLLSVSHDAADILTYNIKLQIHDASFGNLMEIGMFVGIGYNGNLKTAGSGITNGKTHAIDRDRPFLDSRISLTHHIGLYNRHVPERYARRDDRS